jgi:hypothetical protein
MVAPFTNEVREMSEKRTADELAFRDAAALAAMTQLINQEPFCLKPRTTGMQDVLFMSLASTAFRVAEGMLWARNKDFSESQEKN